MENSESFTDRLTAAGIDVNHDWVTKYRVAPVSDMHPAFSFIAALVEGNEGTPAAEYWPYLQPTDEDAQLVGEYIKAYKQWYYNPMYLRKLNERVLDVDGGANTITFARMPHGWVYRMFTWQGQPFAPYKDAEKQYPTLMELLDHIHPYETGYWQKYKVANNL